SHNVLHIGPLCLCCVLLKPIRMPTNGTGCSREEYNMSKNALSRRRFLTTTGVAAGAAAATTLAAPAVLAQAPILIRMQSSWPESDIFQDMAKEYVERVHAMSGGRLRIDLLPAGAVVGAFAVQDACHDGVIDAAHTVPVYWYGKDKAASLFGTGPVFGADANQMI